MPPKKKSADASAADSTAARNRNLTAGTSDAIKRLRREQMFRAAIEQLVQLDCEEERADSLYNIGYCSEVVALGALASGAGAAAALTSAEDTDEEASAAAAAPSQVSATAGKHVAVENVDAVDEDDDGDDPFGSKPRVSYTLAQRRQRRPRDESKGSVSGAVVAAPSVPWNAATTAAALDRALPAAADWSFLASGGSSAGGASGSKLKSAAGGAKSVSFAAGAVAAPSSSGVAATGASMSALALFEELQEQRTRLILDGDEHYQWYRGRSGKLDRMRATWQAQGLSTEEIARKVLL